MRKKLLSTGLIGMSLAIVDGPAMAQSSVTLYGAADIFIQYLNNGGNASVSERSGGATPSMFGLKGSEDLGEGWRANFNLESGYNLNNGGAYVDSASLFYRRAWIGVSHGDYGSLTFGRQNVPTLYAVYFADPFNTNESLSPLDASVLATDRATLSTQSPAGYASNSMLYSSPKLAGFQFHAMYAFPSTAQAPVPSKSGNMVDLAATYSGYGLTVGLAYMYQHGGSVTAPGLPDTLNRVGTRHYTAAVSYNIGIANLQAIYSYASPQTPSPDSLAAAIGAAHAYNLTEIGVTIQATPFDSIEIAGVQRNIHGIEGETLGVQVGYDHYLSKRTELYARAGYMKNHGAATMSWPGVVVSGMNTSQTLVVAGLAHRF